LPELFSTVPAMAGCSHGAHVPLQAGIVAIRVLLLIVYYDNTVFNSSEFIIIR